VVNDEAKQDALLDAIAFVAAVYDHREEDVKAILEANGGCSWPLEGLNRALALLVVCALEDDPSCHVDEALADARRRVLEQF
jgi:hypothetical protein